MNVTPVIKWFFYSSEIEDKYRLLAQLVMVHENGDSLEMHIFICP